MTVNEKQKQQKKKPLKPVKVTKPHKSIFEKESKNADKSYRI